MTSKAKKAKKFPKVEFLVGCRMGGHGWHVSASISSYRFKMSVREAEKVSTQLLNCIRYLKSVNKKASRRRKQV